MGRPSGAKYPFFSLFTFFVELITRHIYLNDFDCAEEGEGEGGEDEQHGEEGDQVTKQTGPVHRVSLIIIIYSNFLWYNLVT